MVKGSGCGGGGGGGGGGGRLNRAIQELTARSPLMVKDREIIRVYNVFI